jgi:hypothetical protein
MKRKKILLAALEQLMNVYYFSYLKLSLWQFTVFPCKIAANFYATIQTTFSFPRQSLSLFFITAIPGTNPEMNPFSHLPLSNHEQTIKSTAADRFSAPVKQQYHSIIDNAS